MSLSLFGLEFNRDTLLLISGGLFLIFLLGYLYLKEGDTARKNKRYEKAIEGLNKEIYRLQKRVREMEDGVDEDLQNFPKQLRTQIYQDVRVEIKNSLESTLKTRFAEFENKIKTDLDQAKGALEGERDRVNSEAEDMRERVIKLEERFKELAYFPSTPTNADEAKIVSMYKEGFSVDNIAKELRLGKGEVEFILKMSKID